MLPGKRLLGGQEEAVQMKKEPQAEAEEPSGNTELSRLVGSSNPGLSSGPCMGRTALVMLCKRLFNTDMEREEPIALDDGGDAGSLTFLSPA